MKLAEWAAQQGISYRTALRWFHRGKVPGARQTPTGRVVVDSGPDECHGACIDEIHIECLVQALQAAGYRIDRDEPEP